MTAQLTATPQLSAGRLATIIASRFVLNSVFRLAYPLIPFVVQRYNVPSNVAPWIVTSAVLAGLASPFGGWLGERLGYRTTMLIGLLLTCGGMALAALAPAFWFLVVAYAVCGTGIAVYQPAMQAYISVLTPYEVRGRAIGLVELSWALAGIAAVPALVQLVAVRGSASSAFTILGGGLALALLATSALPSEGHVPSVTKTSRSFAAMLRNRNVLWLLVFIFLAFAGIELFYIVQPVWAPLQFAASLTDLGTATLVFGIGELVGSSLSAAFTDRLGKLRASTFGFGLTVSMFVLLPILSTAWPIYLVCYLLLAVCVEFAIVSALTLASTVSVVGRAAVMALTITVMQISRAASSQLGVPLLERSSLLVTGLFAAFLTGTAVVVALRYVREIERESLHDRL